MLILEIALGIILASVLVAATPFVLAGAIHVVGYALAAVLRVLATPLPPFWRNPANKKRGPTRYG